MRYGSVCSGVEAASLAWMPLGWECVFVSEVEPFPCAVLQQRFGATAPIHPLDPEEAANEKDRKMRISWMKQNAKLNKEGKIPNEGDFTKIGKKYAGKIDLLVGGTPCQDLSVAGKREGFNGKRSSLAIDFVRLAYESQCKWFVWENVPGVFSSNGGGDFATLLSLFTGCEVGVPEQGFGNAGFVCNARRDRFGVAWRVLDAQFTRVSGFPFAIPQRRRRVFVVGYFGDWTKAAEVCLEPDRLSWNTPARIKTREIFAGNAGTDAGMAGGEFRSSHHGEFVETEAVGTIKLNSASSGNSSITLKVEHAAGFKVDHGNGRITDASCTLDVKCKDGAIRNQSGMVIVETGKGFNSPSDCAGTLESHEDQHRRNIVCAGFMGGQEEKAGGVGYEEQVSPTIKSTPSGGNQIPDIVCAAHKTGQGFWQEGNFAGCLRAEGENRPSRPSNVICHEVASTINAHFGDKQGIENQHVDQGCPLFIIHGSQDPITNTEHVNAVNRNNGLENCIMETYSIGNGQVDCAAKMQREVCRTLDCMHDQQAIVIRNREGKPGGGKGPLISKESNLTLGCNNDQILFEKNGVSQYGEVAGTLEARHDSSPCPDRGQNIVCYDARGNGDGQTVNTITGDHGNRITDYTQIVQECYPINGMVIGKEAKDGDRQTTGIVNDNDPSPTIGAGQHHAVAIAEKVYSLSAMNSNGMKSKTPTGYCHELDSARTLDTTSNDPNKNMGEMAILGHSLVRRLTVIECERLMGFPDNHTRIAYNGKPEEECPDSPRYKACGNSMCVNVMEWIGRQIERVSSYKFQVTREEEDGKQN